MQHVLRRGFLTAAIVIASGLEVSLFAHDPGLSALEIRVGRSDLVATLSLAEADARALGATGSAFPPLHSAVGVWADGIRLKGELQQIAPDATGGLRVTLRFPRGSGARLTITSGVPGLLARGHRELVSIRAESGTLLAERVLDAASNGLVVDIGTRPGGTAEMAGRFFSLGVRHIVSGYDHLLFLAAMLLVAKGLAEGAAIITAFSAAHALALVLAVAGVVSLPGHVVEPLIAASVVWVGVENLFRRRVARRWLPAFGFGVVHGLAFAGALSELGAAESGGSLAVRLAFFNLGIEAGQLAFGLLTVPLLWYARRWPLLAYRAQTAGSLSVAIAGAYWFITRLAALDS